MALLIRPATERDAERVAAIYNWYVLNAICTFETAEVTAEEIARRIQEKLEKHCWLVGEQEGALVTYAYYGAFRPRAAYSHTAESTVYVARDWLGKGLGAAIYSELIAAARRQGVRELVGVIALPNPASIRLHEKLGFLQAGLLRAVGHKFGRYIDVSLWQRSLADA
jgi:L-amino acid N-acyltransferase YncA